MTRGMIRALAGIGASALLLTGCTSEDGNGGGDETGGDGSEGVNVVATEMRSWEPCEVLNNLQPFTEFMGIAEFTGVTTGGDVPESAAWGESTLFPNAMLCAGGIELEAEPAPGSPGTGELTVRIYPLESEEQATDAYEQRVTRGQIGDVETASIDFADPWDEGNLLASTAESGATEYVQVVARDGQWVIDIEIHYTGDFSAQSGGEPVYPFTIDELHQWIIETYLADVNQTVNDKIAEGTGS